MDFVVELTAGSKFSPWYHGTSRGGIRCEICITLYWALSLCRTPHSELT